MTINTRRARITALAGASLLATAILATSVHAAKPAQPTGIERVDFAASHHPTYNHSTGGGFYGDGSNSFVREELELTDFKCGDIVSYILKFEGNGDGGDVTVTWDVDFDFATTGQPGVALVPLTSTDHLLLNVNDAQYADSGEAAVLTFTSTTGVQESPNKLVEKFFSGDTRVTFDVSGVDPGDFIVVRLDNRLDCRYPSRPTGNLLAKAAAGIAGERVNVGEQTVPMKIRDVVYVGDPY